MHMFARMGGWALDFGLQGAVDVRSLGYQKIKLETPKAREAAKM